MDTWDAQRAAGELLSVLPLLSRIVASEVRREAGEETTMPQFRVLAHLTDGPLTLSELARLRRVTLQSMGELAQALVARGWIARTPDPSDRRQQLLSLTEHGRRHYERAQAQLAARITPLLTQLADEEMRAIAVALPALRRVLAGEDEG
jgi:DNA-binding MarR family transcriptional regulator